MFGLFLRRDAREQIFEMSIDASVKAHALEVIGAGYTVTKGVLPADFCRKVIGAVRDFERENKTIFGGNRNNDVYI
jgi:hypothetical protein